AAMDSVHAGMAVCPQVYIPNLSLQTVVVLKSLYPNEGDAATAAVAAGNQMNPPQAFRTDLWSEDATSWRFRQAEGDCRYNSLHTLGIENAVWVEVCLNARAPSRGFRVPMCLYRGDLWEQQSGEVLRPTPDHCPRRAADGTCLADTLACVKDDKGLCRE